MTIENLKEMGLDDANIQQVFKAVLSGVKVDFIKTCLKEREKQLEKQIKENPSFYVANGTYKVNWGYYDSNDEQIECYELAGLIYELNALKSTRLKCKSN